MPQNNERRMRYPGNDPENGPAEWHRYVGGRWRSEREMREASYDWRKRKRHERKGGFENAAYWAWLQGQDDSAERRPCRAHTMYAPGKRRSEYLRGYYGR